MTSEQLLWWIYLPFYHYLVVWQPSTLWYCCCHFGVKQHRSPFTFIIEASKFFNISFVRKYVKQVWTSAKEYIISELVNKLDATPKPHSKKQCRFYGGTQGFVSAERKWLNPCKMLQVRDDSKPETGLNQRLRVKRTCQINMTGLNAKSEFIYMDYGCSFFKIRGLYSGTKLKLFVKYAGAIRS